MSKYSKLKKELLQNKNCPTMSTNDNTIHISVDDISQVISPYSEDNRPVINNEFAEFLNNSVKDISIKQNITLEITSKNCDHETISSAIKSYYYNEFVDSQRKLKFNLFASLSTLIIGLLALALSLLQNVVSYSLLAGVIDIFAWVFVWEAVDLFFFRRAELKHLQHRQMKQVQNCGILTLIPNCMPIKYLQM